MLANRYGSFDPSGRAYRITDSATPMPWCNVVCNGRYGFVVSQNGGGFSWFDDAQHNVLTRWEMDLVRDCYGKFLYVADRDSGALWSLAPAPIQPRYDEYSCTHTLGASTFRTAAHGIAAEWTMSVLHDSPVEVWHVTLKNTTNAPRRLRVSSYFEWTCGVAPDVKREFHRLFFNTWLRKDGGRRAIVATKNMWDIPPKNEKQHWNVPWPYVAAHAVLGSFERDLSIGDKSTFLGRYGMTTSPHAMTCDAPTDGPNAGKFGRFGDAAAALGGDLTIAPGASVTLVYLLSIGANENEAIAHLDRIPSATAAATAIAEAGKAWDTRLAPTAIETERPDFDLLNNYWLPYQAISGRMWGRTGYYQQSGAYGFRDQLQDSQVWLPIDPAMTARQIMMHAGRQFADGSVHHWWHALADFGKHMACSDDYLWLPFVTCNYIKETGDFAILDRHAPFLDDKNGATLLEHCLRAIRRTFKRTSERGIPHIGSCDWNDGLSAMGVDEKGESVWLGMFLAGVLEDFAVVLDRRDDAAMAREFRAKRQEYINAINTHAWDGNWYRYGTLDSGEWIGSSQSIEGKIHLNAQTWAIITDAADNGRAASAWESVKQHLLSPYGPLLLAPAYTIPDARIGYITRYSPGSRENGGVYMHAATWALLAACKRRDVESVQRIWRSISPPTRGQDAEGYRAEPYVTPGNVDGPLSDLPGRAGWTWYTGSAAWMNRVCLEWVLGIRPTWNGLLVDPCPPAELGRVSATRTWRGVRVNVHFDAREFVPGVLPTLKVNGKPASGNVIVAPEATSGVKSLDIEVHWAAGASTRPVDAAAAGRSLS
ncbi:MAG: glycosyl transferase family 36 [Planctomycetota bacterium]|nr:glycosyl transferase family 36 [Planctomycetota bacterium]